MVTFRDGPAQGAELSLSRTPFFLRAVISKSGEVDALDLLEDKPRPDETVYLYVIASQPIYGIMCSRRRGKEGGCRRVVSAEYKLWPNPPDDETLRDTDKWREWADKEGEERYAKQFVLREVGGDDLPR